MQYSSCCSRNTMPREWVEFSPIICFPVTWHKPWLSWQWIRKHDLSLSVKQRGVTELLHARRMIPMRFRKTV
ncbi:hypothetical protein CEXT_734981 [Caerostris extrusa]|uniref:Uncharacterized protein n=1 Tax=Caerostris extrusa TaxID=172846 RepID=A0AAV4MMS1_CAEEX|nr:hypothetical protein CEXT_734981 [Caerostris extrusa]